jgi:hypothetical protein
MQDRKTEFARNPHILQIIARQLFNFHWHRSIERRDIAPFEPRLSGYYPLTWAGKLVPVHIVCRNITRHCLGGLGLHQHIIATHRHGQYEARGSSKLF